MCQLTCVKNFPSNKDVSLDLAPFSENDENHWSRECASQGLSIRREMSLTPGK